MRAFLTGPEKLEIAARVSVPYALMFVLALMDIMAMPYPLNLMLDAPFILMALYYWSVYRPTLLPVWLCFIVGLVLDILSGYPLGMSALIFIMMRWFLLDQRKYLLAQGFMIFWLGFGMLCSFYYAAIWLFMSVASFRFMPVEGLIAPWVLGILIFPVISAFLRLSHKIL